MRLTWSLRDRVLESFGNSLAQKNHDVKPHVFTEKSDVYAFRVTSYEVLTGGAPFEDVSRSRCYNALSGGKPKLPEAVKPALK